MGEKRQSVFNFSAYKWSMQKVYFAGVWAVQAIQSSVVFFGGGRGVGQVGRKGLLTTFMASSLLHQSSITQPRQQDQLRPFLHSNDVERFGVNAKWLLPCSPLLGTAVFIHSQLLPPLLEWLAGML